MSFSFYELMWWFLIYAFLGWGMEVAFMGWQTHNFVNRGFLNGPVCPIYGVGAVIIILCLTPLKHTWFVLLIGSIFLTSLLEYLTGFVLEKIFHEKWWDYSQIKFNINGYICLRFSLLWGIACMVLMYAIHPGVSLLVKAIPFALGLTLLIILACAFVADVSVTCLGLLKIKKNIRQLQELTSKLKSFSDVIGENLFEGASRLQGEGAKLLEHMEVKYHDFDKQKQFVEDIKEQVRILQTKTTKTQQRLVKAFPHLDLSSAKILKEKVKKRKK